MPAPPKLCIGTTATHYWPEDAAEGDTCNCGEWYRFADRIEAVPPADDEGPVLGPGPLDIDET